MWSLRLVMLVVWVVSAAGFVVLGSRSSPLLSILLAAFCIARGARLFQRARRTENRDVPALTPGTLLSGAAAGFMVAGLEWLHGTANGVNRAYSSWTIALGMTVGAGFLVGSAVTWASQRRA